MTAIVNQPTCVNSLQQLIKSEKSHKKKPCTSFQQQLTKVVNIYECFKKNIDAIEGNFSFFKVADPILNKIFLKKEPNRHWEYNFPNERELFFKETLLRFMKYSAYPQETDQIYELFSTLNCRRTCIAIATPLPTKLRWIVKEYIGTIEEEWFFNKDWLGFYVESCNGSFKDDFGSTILGIANFLKKNHDHIVKYPQLMSTLRTYILSQLPPEKTLVLKAKLAALEANFKKQKEAAKAKNRLALSNSTQVTATIFQPSDSMYG